jgi:ribosomal protein S14
MKRTFKNKIYKYSKYYKKYELYWLLNKGIISDLRLVNIYRYFFFFFIKQSYITKINYFCINTNQLRGLVHFFNTFRMNFRDNALFARYSGIKKKTW